MTDLSKFELETLMAVWQLRGDAYGVTIAEKLRDRTGNEPSVGKLYAALDRLTDWGFVETQLGEPTKIRGGRRKKFFRITGAGQGAASNALQALRSLADGLPVGDIASAS